MKILTIQRSKWKRGGDDFNKGRTCLLNDYGMCCLGFDAVASGIPAIEIENLDRPEDISPSVLERFPEYISKRLKRFEDSDYFAYSENDLVSQAININDNKNITDAEREAQLKPVLMQMGWDDVVFVD